MVQQEVRGVYVINCVECPFRKYNMGGYDRERVESVTCIMRQRLIGDGECNTSGFPKMCPLNPIKNQETLIYQRYKRILEQLKLIDAIIKDD